MFSVEVTISVQRILFRPAGHYSAGQTGTIRRSLNGIKELSVPSRADSKIETRGIICSKKVISSRRLDETAY